MKQIIDHYYVTEGNKDIIHFENGVILEAGEDDKGHVTYPAKDGMGSFGFPVKFLGDVFFALQAEDAIPAHCKAW